MMIILEMAHHAQIGQASIFKQTQVILIDSDLNETTDCTFDFYILNILILLVYLCLFQQKMYKTRKSKGQSVSVF